MNNCKFFLGLLLLVVSVSASAGWVLYGGTVKGISSASWNEDVIVAIIEGGSGDCADRSIAFPRKYPQSDIAYQNQLSLLMFAYATGKKVDVHNYNDQLYRGDKCFGVNLVQVKE